MGRKKQTQLPKEGTKAHKIWRLCEAAYVTSKNADEVLAVAEKCDIDAATTRAYMSQWSASTGHKLLYKRDYARNARVEALLTEYRKTFGCELPWKRYLRTDEIKKAIERKKKK